MPVKDLTFSIRPVFRGEEAKKQASKVTTELRDQTKAVDRLNKESKKYLTDTDRGFVRLGRSVLGASRDMVSGLGKVGGAIDSINSKIKAGVGHVVNFRNVIAGSIVGGLAIAGVSKIFGEGQKQLLAQERLKREFGADAGFFGSVSARVGKRAGLQDDDALRSLFSIGEAVSGTQAGIGFRGKKLNASQATALRKNTFEFGAKLFERVATVTGAKGEEAEQLAYLLSNAGSGPEGMRGLVAALHLNKAVSSEILKANAKGKLASFLGPEAAKQFGVKNGQVAGQGTVIDILLQRSGITDKAAEDARKKFGFQLKSIGATLDDVFGQVGARALDRVNGGFAKGTTLAEKLQTILESKKGADTIKKIGDGIGSMVEGLIKLGLKIPEIIGFVERHKTAIELIGGAYVGLSVLGKGRSLLGNALGGGKGGLPGIGGGAIPVQVAGMAGSVSTLLGIAIAGAIAKKAFDSTKIGAGGGRGASIDDVLENGGAGFKNILEKSYGNPGAIRGKGYFERLLPKNLSAGDRERFNAIAADTGTDYTQKTAQFQSFLSSVTKDTPIVIENHTHTHLDGDEISHKVERKIVRGARNATAGGASR